MSNYHPHPPTFGTPFNPNLHMESTVGSYDHGLPQYPYQYRNSTSLYGQGQTNGMPILPHTNENAHSFRSNTQRVTNLSSGNEANGVPYAHHGGQIQYNAFQSPGFSPSPFSHGAPSHEARAFNQPSASSNFPAISRAVFSSLPAAAEVQSTNTGDSDTVPPALSELEDGEVDDGEAEVPTSHSRASTMTSSGMSQHKRHENKDFVDREFGHRVSNAPRKPLSGLIQGSLTTPNSQSSITSQPPPYSMRNGFIDDSDKSLLSPTVEHTSAENHPSTTTAAQGSKEASLKLVGRKMEEAKQALRDLHSQGFDFNQIVNAGLNPDALRKLYATIGAPYTSSSSVNQQENVKPRVIAWDVPAESAPSAATMGTYGQSPVSQEKESIGDVHGNDVSPYLVAEEGKISSQPTVAAPKNGGKLVQSPVGASKSSKPSSLNPMSKTTGSKAGQTKKLDRKEYIARMLAAKAGKPAISAPTPVSPKTSTITDSGASTQVQSSEAATAVIPAAAQQAPSESVDIAPGSQKEDADADAEAKRKAQTDLARQKIEALKLHKSIQLQARSTMSSDSFRQDQQPPAKGASNVSAETSVPTPRPLPSRQSSYFSPASQKNTFSIPGLFMTPHASDLVNPSQPLANESLAGLPTRVDHTTFGSSQQGLGPRAAVSAQSPTTDKTSRFPETFVDLNVALPAIVATTTTASTNRKRQKASDFIDSPSTRVKRPLGQQEDTSVIIDISDDEISSSTSGDDSFDTDVAGHRDSPSRKSQVIAPGNGIEKPIKGLPPLTDFPPRKKPSVMTPPTANTSGQAGDLKGLKSKEMEIEFMNRKIAELEQRIAIKAKQTSSRTHSPGNPSRVTQSPPPGETSHQINGGPNVPLSSLDSRNGGAARIENRESFIVLAGGSNSAAAEQLNAEQQLEEVEMAKAEAERSLAEISRASVVDQLLPQDERIQTQRTEEQSNLREQGQRLKDEEQKRVHDEEQRRLEETQSQQARVEETKRFEQEQRRAHEVREERFQEQARKRSLEDQWQARKSEIESGLPLLDAEVERTRTRLESLREEITGLEMELQKGIEGRQDLIKELNNLSRSRETLPGPMDLDSFDVSDVPKRSLSNEKLPAVTKPSTSIETVLDSHQPQISSAVGDGEVVRENYTSPQAAPSTLAIDDQLSDGEVEEDIMDISHSGVDQSEPLLHSPKPLIEVQDTSGFIDDDENYEPPSEISIIQIQKTDRDAVLLKQDFETTMASLPAATQNQPSTDQDAEPIEKPTSGEPSPAANANLGGDEQSQRSLSRSPSLAEISDLDEYEPPEPATSGEEVARPAQIPSVDPEKSFSPPDMNSIEFVAPVSSDATPVVQPQVSPSASTVRAKSHSMQEPESNSNMGQFTPYESPLKQFKSYRYHPQYLKEVSSGFRSLTYSHTINPEIPLCRYELDGVCNDDSCQSQHLSSIGLSDDKILVDLGAKPDNGSSPDDFGNGLREIIHDIRSRKIRDFNIVAGEITAYRAQFLGDSSKVLPL